MTGLAGVLSLTVAGVVVAVLIAAICITRRKIVSQNKDNTPSHGMIHVFSSQI